MAVASTKDLLTDLSPLIQVYTDGTVHRLISSPHVPPSPEDPATAVASKDIFISPSIPARLYLPKLAASHKLPILLYHHGGGFCLESAFSLLHHRYANLLSAASAALILSVEYRLAPEHPLPAAYDDSAAALSWLCSHALDQPGFEKDQWIADHGDLRRIFIAGDGNGANIAHNVTMRAGSDPLPGNVKVNGVILCHPFFCGSDESEEDLERSLGYRLWSFVYPSAAGGIDDPAINPLAAGAPSLSGLGCSKMIVCLAEKDPSAARGRVYAEMVRLSGWEGEVETAEFEGEGHCFQISDTQSQNAKNFINRLVAFISR
ncbi:2-hydroxyisoflavanone dehydratase [Salvia divinorum]|uniref:2-hydroxyisoflavanone dehydratase n=1 Tax=Salvia divinorum TaxID=28513 RepID=A0ABD1FZU8_SALDI